MEPYFDIGNTKIGVHPRLYPRDYQPGRISTRVEHGSRVRGQLLTKRLMLSDSPFGSGGSQKCMYLSTAYLFSLPPLPSPFLSIWPACFALRYVYEEALDVSPPHPSRAVPSRKTPAWKTGEKLFTECLPRRRKKNVS